MYGTGSLGLAVALWNNNNREGERICIIVKCNVSNTEFNSNHIAYLPMAAWGSGRGRPRPLYLTLPVGAVSRTTVSDGGNLKT